MSVYLKDGDKGINMYVNRYGKHGLGAAAALHSSVELGDITAVALLFLPIPAPLLIERRLRHGLDVMQNLALILLFNTINQLVEDPRSWRELQGS